MFRSPFGPHWLLIVIFIPTMQSQWGPILKWNFEIIKAKYSWTECAFNYKSKLGEIIIQKSSWNYWDITKRDTLRDTKKCFLSLHSSCYFNVYDILSLATQKVIFWKMFCKCNVWLMLGLMWFHQCSFMILLCCCCCQCLRSRLSSLSESFSLWPQKDFKPHSNSSIIY